MDHICLHYRININALLDVHSSETYIISCKAVYYFANGLYIYMIYRPKGHWRHCRSPASALTKQPWEAVQPSGACSAGLTSRLFLTHGRQTVRPQRLSLSQALLGAIFQRGGLEQQTLAPHEEARSEASQGAPTGRNPTPPACWSSRLLHPIE